MHKRDGLSHVQLAWERKIEYIITDEGLKRVKEELRRLKEIYEIGVEILKGRVKIMIKKFKLFMNPVSDLENAE